METEATPGALGSNAGLGSLVERLREACSGTNYNWQIELHNEAADEIERLRAALGEYANALNWNEDDAGIRRVWLEPDSSTPEHYNGFEAARAALKA